MGLPIYQMDVYQTTPPKVKHTDITQKSPNWFRQLGNIKSLQKNPKKFKHTGITQKSQIWSWQLENIESLQKKPNKI